jgi:hydroxymethylbilane synthase
MRKILRIGTRGSALALVQAESVKRRLIEIHPDLKAEGSIEIVPIRTAGDWDPGMKIRTLADMGGTKGLFTKEIEEALLAGFVDLAVHSMKDVATAMPERLDIAALLPRADPRDAFFARNVKTIQELPPGATLGTASLRRQAQVLALRPDLNVVPFRGNVDTRLKKMMDGEVDATLLAVAGIERLGLTQKISSIMDTKHMLPCPAQGAIGIQIRQDDDANRLLIAPLNHAPTESCVRAERELLRVLDGSCRTPIAALGTIQSGKIHLDALVAGPDGKHAVRKDRAAPVKDAITLGGELGEELKRLLPPDFLKP